jgi:hypothetical protein
VNAEELRVAARRDRGPEADESDSLDDDIAVQLSEGELEALAAEAAEALDNE